MQENGTQATIGGQQAEKSTIEVKTLLKDIVACTRICEG